MKPLWRASGRTPSRPCHWRAARDKTASTAGNTPGGFAPRHGLFEKMDLKRAGERILSLRHAVPGRALVYWKSLLEFKYLL